MIRLIKPCVFLLLIFFTWNVLSQNVIKDPGFEDQQGTWNIWGGELSTNPHSGQFSLKIFNEEAKWSGADQKVILPANAKKIEVSGWMKTENIIKGANPWEMARISIEFHDDGGQMVGGYPPVVGQRMGTSEWKEYKMSYDIPFSIQD